MLQHVGAHPNIVCLLGASVNDGTYINLYTEKQSVQNNYVTSFKVRVDIKQCMGNHFEGGY